MPGNNTGGAGNDDLYFAADFEGGIANVLEFNDFDDTIIMMHPDYDTPVQEDIAYTFEANRTALLSYDHPVGTVEDLARFRDIDIIGQEEIFPFVEFVPISQFEYLRLALPA